MKKQDISARYIKSIDGTDDILYDGKPHVAFVGRSNVGKSSLINSLLGKDLARSSSNPGKTVLLDIFFVKDAFYFVDLPGYGFANVSKKRQEHFRKLIAWYLFFSGVFHALVVIIIDAKIGITDYDKETIDLCTQFSVPFVIVANKVDKIKASNKHARLAALKKQTDAHETIVYSSVTGEGKGALWDRISGAVRNSTPRF